MAQIQYLFHILCLLCIVHTNNSFCSKFSLSVVPLVEKRRSESLLDTFALFVSIIPDYDATGLMKEKLYRYLELKSRPPFVGIPRNRLDLQFAVQLMRSSYNSVDELDFIPMDIFQKLFFLFRQSEWEDYKNYHQSVLQGDLADPLYFDFISFCQYAVISDGMKKGMYDFTERIGAEGKVQRVIRKSVVNEDLPRTHGSLVGNKILSYITEKYNQTSVSLQSIPVGGKDINQFLSIGQDILDIFAINAFAVDLKLSFMDRKDESSLCKLSLKVPANLWSQQVLRVRKDNPLNDFENKVMNSLSTKLGFKYEVISTSLTNSIDMNHIVKLT